MNLLQKAIHRGLGEGVHGGLELLILKLQCLWRAISEDKFYTVLVKTTKKLTSVNNGVSKQASSH